MNENRLGATVYVLDQSSLITAIFAAGTTPPPSVPPGEYHTYQVPITDIAAMTGLGLAQLTASDRAPVPTSISAGGTCPDGTGRGGGAYAATTASPLPVPGDLERVDGVDLVSGGE